MLKFSFLILLLGLDASASDLFSVGQRDYVFKDAARNRKLVTHVWYPVDAKTQITSQDQGPFVPVMAAKDAPLMQTQKFPVVLLSHGSGGIGYRLFWLADPLVRSGMIVIAVDHQGNKLMDNSGDGLMRVWERPRDLSFALDQVLQIPEFKTQIDLTRVAAVGHSAGGTTVLLLGGARLSHEKFKSPIPLCAGSKDPYFSKLCEQIKTLDLKTYSKDIVERDHSDSRVKAVVAMDPGFAQSFETDSLKQMRAKPFVWVADRLMTPQDEIFSKDFLKDLPKGSAEILPQSVHMTFLQACKPGVSSENDELKLICDGDLQKIKHQKEVAQKTLDFFRNSWSEKRY